MEGEHRIACEVRLVADGQHGLVERSTFVVDQIGEAVDASGNVVEPAPRGELADLDRGHACLLCDVGRDVPTVRNSA